MLHNGFADTDWASDPRVSVSASMAIPACCRKPSMKTGRFRSVSFLATDQMISLDDWPFLYLEPCRPQDANSPIIYGESFRDWLEDQEGMTHRSPSGFATLLLG